jgi:hypothetical protein
VPSECPLSAAGGYQAGHLLVAVAQDLDVIGLVFVGKNRAPSPAAEAHVVDAAAAPAAFETGTINFHPLSPRPRTGVVMVYDAMVLDPVQPQIATTMSADVSSGKGVRRRPGRIVLGSPPILDRLEATIVNFEQPIALWPLCRLRWPIASAPCVVVELALLLRLALGEVQDARADAAEA